MQEIDVLTIGLVLLAFLLGGIIVGLAAQSRSRRQQEAYAEQVRRLRDDDRKLLAALEASEAHKDQVALRLEETQRALDAGERESEILRAQFQEEQEAAYGLEDRLNATEARLLSADAELAENRLEMLRWDAAYNRLKESHVRLADAHHETRSREEELSRVVASGSGELGVLQSRLDLLQSALSVALHIPASDAVRTDPAALIPAQLRELALAKVEVQSEVRRREDEITLLQSQLAATRFSLSILAASGAELASRINEDLSDAPSIPAVAHAARTGNAAVQEEQLASLEGMIADWFEEMRGEMPYSPKLLRTFSGATFADRHASANVPPLGLAQSEEDLRRAPDLDALEMWLADAEQGNLESAPTVSHDVMLAAIKAASVAALRRSKIREAELLTELGKAQSRLAEMQESIAMQNLVVVEELQDVAIPPSSATSPSVGQNAEALETGSATETNAATTKSAADASPAMESSAADMEFADTELADTATADIAAAQAATTESTGELGVEELLVLKIVDEGLAEEEAAAADVNPVYDPEENRTVDSALTESNESGAQTESAGSSASVTVPADIESHSVEAAPLAPAALAISADDQGTPTRPTVAAGIPRADVPMPATPKPTVPKPAVPGPAAEQATQTPPLRTAWGRFVRRVGSVVQRPSGRR